MDPDPSIGLLISLCVVMLISVIIRMLRTAVMTCDGSKLDDSIRNTIENREDVISELQMSYNVLKTIFMMMFTVLLIRNLDKFDFERSIDILIMGASTILLMFMYDLITIEFADRFGAHRPNKCLNIFKVFLITILALLKPIYKMYMVIKKIVVKLIGLPKATHKVTIDQIKMLVDIGEKQGIINSAERDMIDGVMEFNETVAEEIMTPRTEVFMIDINSEPKDYLEDLINHRYSRIPVYDNNIDDIIGILYLKDFLTEAYKKGFENVELKKLIKPAYFMPERKNIHTLFQEMQRMNKHMTILMDEYGGFSGILTMEDLTEEIMGEIDDEFDDDEPDWYEVTKNTAVIQGTTSIKDVNDMLGINLPDDTDDYDTIAGFIISRLGFIPEDTKVEMINYDGLRIKVLEVEDRRIKKVKIFMSKPKEVSNPEIKKEVNDEN